MTGRSPQFFPSNKIFMSFNIFGTTPKLYWQWVRLNALGFGIATTICLSAQVSEFNIEMLWLSGLIVGSITGICQAIALKKKIPKLRYWQWILANIVGGYVGIIGGFWIIFNFLESSLQVSPYLGLSLFGGLVGLGISLAQMFMLLFHTHKRSILLWGFTNTVARAIAWGCSSFMLRQLFPESVKANEIIFHVPISLVSGLIGGTIFGLITGVVLGNLQPKYSVVTTGDV